MKFPIFNKLFNSLCSLFQSKITVGFSLSAMIFVFAVGAQAASPGALDLSFGTRGVSAFRLNADIQEGYAIAIQADGKTVLAGRAINGGSYDIVLVRFNTNGTIDSGFGANGVVLTDFSGQNDSAETIIVQSDGKIAVAGFSSPVSQSNNIVTVLARYLPNGSLDTAFGTGGKVSEAFDNARCFTRSIILQPDGKIVAVATNGTGKFCAARFDAGGGLDTGFAATGKIVSDAYSIDAPRVARQTDGKIVVASSSIGSEGALKLIRLNADGTIDNGFGTAGVITTGNFGGSFFTPTVAVQADNKIIVAGGYDTNRGKPPLARYNANGSVDTSFVPYHGEPVNGFCQNCTQSASKILLLPDGRFYLVGYSSNGGDNLNTVAVSRYLNNGTIDSSYGFRGASYLKLSNALEASSSNFSSLHSVRDAALQADGKVVTAATSKIFANNTLQYTFFALRSTATVTPPTVRSDFDGDRKTDFSVFRPSSRTWFVLNSGDNSLFALNYGLETDLPAPSDYNYDGKTDIAVFRASESKTFVSASQPSGGTFGGAFGQSGDINVPEDFDGDGYTDLAVFRPSNATWFIRYSSFSRIVSTSGAFQFGLSTDKPVPADYDGDGKADIAVFRPSNGGWYILRSSDSGLGFAQFGVSTDKAVPADYDSDGKTDIAVFRDGTWFILQSSNGGFVAVQFGAATDKPVPGDYDGDGKTDIAVFRPSEGFWYVRKSSDSSIAGQQWGISEDTPTPFTFVR